MKKIWCLIGMLLICLLLAGCTAIGSEIEDGVKNPVQEMENTENTDEKPIIPSKLKVNDVGIPILKVYHKDDDEIREMELENYLQGVLAGEMKNDWPLEALKAQAILARTFVMKFCQEKESKFSGADISTDIEEAQAYDETGINERIEQAVRETQGMVISYKGEFPYAWFHAHSGGKTARAKEGLAYKEDEPGYTMVTDGKESDKAPEDAKAWTANFTKDEVIRAAKEAGIKEIDSLESIEIGEKGESGRVTTLKINGESVAAADFRIAIGSTKMRSTMLTQLALNNDTIIMRGRGYGHGVGMPQWGAYALAEEGMNAEEIVKNYFSDVEVLKIW